MPSIAKKLILVFIVLGLLVSGVFFGIRPLWLGYETTKHVGTLKDIRLVERPLCKYWEGTLVTSEPGKPQESFPFWVDISQQEISAVLNQSSSIDGKVEVLYRRSTAYRLWLCTPHTGQMLSLVPIATPPVPLPTPVPAILPPPASPPIHTPPVPVPSAPALPSPQPPETHPSTGSPSKGGPASQEPPSSPTTAQEPVSPTTPSVP